MWNIRVGEKHLEGKDLITFKKNSEYVFLDFNHKKRIGDLPGKVPLR